MSVATMSSSDDMVELLTEFPNSAEEMLDKHYLPFVEKFTTSAAPLSTAVNANATAQHSIPR